jgi:hypothetical protein
MSQNLQTTNSSLAPEQGRAPVVDLSDEDREALRRAVQALEAISFAARLSAVAGRPIELLGQALPQPVSEAVSRATKAALTRALQYALRTIPQKTANPETRLHRALAALSGAMGGALGITAVLVELPISTTIMLRAIARIAQSEGEDLSDPETTLACLQVFALGGRTRSEHLHESGYFAVRAAMARSLTGALQQVASRGWSTRVPPLSCASSARSPPASGWWCPRRLRLRRASAGGDQRGGCQHAVHRPLPGLAQGHFTVRRLERIYGPGTVRLAYEQIRAGEAQVH